VDQDVSTEAARSRDHPSGIPADGGGAGSPHDRGICDRVRAEFTHFIFPILKPAIQPELAGSISQAVSNGRFVADMRNYWVKTTGVYYFPGMYTAILPMIPGIYTIRRVITGSRRVVAA